MEETRGKILGWLTTAAVALAVAAPAAAQRRPVALDEVADSLRAGQYAWRDVDPSAGEIAIVVSIPQQLVYVYRGATLVGVATASTGRAGHRTPTGEFSVLQKQVFHRSNLYSNAPMPYMQRLTWDGIALHAGVNPGFPASHGCIRLPRPFAALLYAVTTLGAAVAVIGDDGLQTPPARREFPVIIAEAGALFLPGFADVTWSSGAWASSDVAMIPVATVSAGLHVTGDEWLVPDARLRRPSWR